MIKFINWLTFQIQKFTVWYVIKRAEYLVREKQKKFEDGYDWAILEVKKHNHEYVKACIQSAIANGRYDSYYEGAEKCLKITSFWGNRKDRKDIYNEYEN